MRKPAPVQKKLTPFERETERRRREMKRSLSQRVSRIPNKLLKRFIHEGVKPVMGENSKGDIVHLTKKYPTRRNPFREMARMQKHGRKVEQKQEKAA